MLFHGHTSYIPAQVSNTYVPSKTRICPPRCHWEISYVRSLRLVHPATFQIKCIKSLFSLQADEDFIIQFRVEQFRLPCGTQWLKIRDGNSLSSNLLADLWGGRDTQPSIVNSTGSNLLLEYFSDEVFSVSTSMARHDCGGGFLAQALQISMLFGLEQNV